MLALAPVDFRHVEQALSSTRGVLELAAVGGCFLAAWIADYALRRVRRVKPEFAGIPGGMVRVFFPLAALLLLIIARGLWLRSGRPFFFEIAIPLAIAVVATRMIVYVMRRLFAKAAWLASSERAITLAVLAFLILYYIGVLPQIAEELDKVELPVGKGRVSLLTIIAGSAVVVATLVVSLWVSGFIEARLMASQIDGNMRVVMSKVVRASLLVVGILVALQAVGIDLTLLSVFGGAVGVGIGLGLQKLASNYIAGFTILLDRSIRLGDLVTVDGRHGVVSRLTSRYVVVRSGDGVEAIVPNETLVTTTVLNHSYSNRDIRLALQVGVAYDADLDLALRLMVDAAIAHPRVLAAPHAPSALVTGFGDNAINLELGVWIGDPENGQGNLRSDLSRAVLDAFRRHGIGIPFPQRDVRVVGGWPPSLPDPK